MAKGVTMGAATTFMFLALLQTLQLTEAQIGVCYGKYAGVNLPSSQDVVSLYKQYGIGAMRIYDLDQDILQALQGSGIKTIIQVPNANLQSVGTDPGAANQFVQTYVAPYASSIKYIAVGNEVVTQMNEAAQYVGPAMQNVLNALNNANLGGYNIKVTTAIETGLVVNSYPPSDGYFSNTAFMNPVVDFLVANGSPLLVNIYTYFSYDQSLNYRLFTSPGTVFTDSNNGLPYQNLFDAIMDATYAALSKAGTTSLRNGGGSNVAIVGSESGWQSGFSNSGADISNDQSSDSTPQNAQTYYSNLINHVKGGTPLKRQPIEMYLFEMFDEANKPGEQNFGLFHADKSPKYNLNFN